MTINKIIEFEHVNKSLGDFKLKDLSFSVNEGSITGFIGSNGMGKTSTIKLLLGLSEPDSGSIKLFGLGHENDTKNIKKRIGFVHSEANLHSEATVKEAKQIISRFYEEWDEELFQKFIADFGLPMKKKIRLLSTGMKMKLNLALALSHNADLLILDEPTSGLDPVFRRELLESIKELAHEQNKTIFFSTHITSDLEQIADQIIFINNGQILLQDSQEAILKNARVLKGPLEELNENNSQNLIGLRKTASEFEALTMNFDRDQKLFGESVKWTEASLEDIIFYTVRRR